MVCNEFTIKYIESPLIVLPTYPATLPALLYLLYSTYTALLCPTLLYSTLPYSTLYPLPCSTLPYPPPLPYPLPYSTLYPTPYPNCPRHLLAQSLAPHWELGS